MIAPLLAASVPRLLVVDVTTPLVRTIGTNETMIGMNETTTVVIVTMTVVTATMIAVIVTAPATAPAAPMTGTVMSRMRETDAMTTGRDVMMNVKMVQMVTTGKVSLLWKKTGKGL